MEWGDIIRIAAWVGLGASVIGGAYLFFIVDDDAAFLNGFGDYPRIPDEWRP